LRTLPLSQFLPIAARHSFKQWEEAGAAEFVSRSFEFTRWCKGHLELTHLTASEGEAVIDFEPLTDWLDYEGEYRFGKEWCAVSHIPGMAPLEWALLMSDHFQLQPNRSSRLYSRFISVAGWMQVLLRGQPIFIPCSTWAAVLKVSKQTISYLRNDAEK